MNQPCVPLREPETLHPFWFSRERIFDAKEFSSRWSACKTIFLFFHLSNTAGRIETRINYSASKNPEEQEAPPPPRTHRPIRGGDLGSGLEQERGGRRCIRVTSPGRRKALGEMNFADTIAPNRQVEATSGDSFSRLPQCVRVRVCMRVCARCVWTGVVFVSHQAPTERSEDKRHPRDECVRAR